jgi:NTE family protein
MKSFALALGGGGARGFAHIPVIEALEEMGVRPVAIAGVSIGAAIGAAYAAGISAKTLRRRAIEIAHQSSETWGRLSAARALGLRQALAAGWGNPLLLDAHKVCAAFLPEAVPDDFAQLEIPLILIATDLHARSEVAFTTGDLKTAVAASMALPGLLLPVESAGRVLVDGAAVNPLPFDHLAGKADLVVAVDPSGSPIDAHGVPNPLETMFATLQVMSDTILAFKLARGAPDLVIRPKVGVFRLLDFLRASAILRAADAVKAEAKERLGAMLNA